jgi:ketosteroid isomerase-like protein
LSTQDEIRSASDRFYAALNGLAAGDANQFSDVWSHGEGVTTMHPIGGEQVGWSDVRQSFEQVAGLASGGHVELADRRIYAGEDLAYELGYERGQMTIAGESVSIDHRVTNIYRREGGQWKMVHHHADISPAMVEILRRLQAA